ncbi:MAG: endonuclease/exonuclease/phosphatase family protein [candidate division WOR-3 bacterium]
MQESTLPIVKPESHRAFATLALGWLLLAGCESGPQKHNIPPTVVITKGPSGTIATDSAVFAWAGKDLDGTVTGFWYALDDSAAKNWTEDTVLTIRKLSLGQHEFHIQAVDDSGARSSSAYRTFWVDFDSLVLPRGTDTTLEIATWNIENFPKLDDSTVNRVRALMARLDLDIYALQEIADTLAFHRLLSGLTGYAGLYSRDDYGSFYQKTGVVYKTSVVTLTGVRQLFWGNDSVTRPPLEMTVTASYNGKTFDFRLIVLHLKAGGSSSDQALRRATCRLLKDYIDQALAQGPELDFVVAGDWNDLLEDPPQWNIFQRFLDDSTNYRFLTMSLAGNTRYGSYIYTGLLIDHIMVTTDALAEYLGGITQTLRLDDEVSRYEAVVSDHRPVMSTFPVFRGLK